MVPLQTVSSRPVAGCLGAEPNPNLASSVVCAPVKEHGATGVKSCWEGARGPSLLSYNT